MIIELKEEREGKKKEKAFEPLKLLSIHFTVISCPDVFLSLSHPGKSMWFHTEKHCFFSICGITKIPFNSTVLWCAGMLGFKLGYNMLLVGTEVCLWCSVLQVSPHLKICKIL